VVVKGQTTAMPVRCMGFGLTMTQGLVLRVSRPFAGLSEAQWML
jgi:hypothetical protein